MDELFKEISDSRRIRSHGNTTYLKDGRLFANENILRGYEDAQQIKQMFSTAADLGTSFVKNIPNIGIGVTKGILPGIANLGEETMRTVLGSTLTDMFSETVNSIPGFSSLNDYLVDATTPEGTAQEISSGLGEAVGQIVVPGALISKGLKVYGYGNTFLRNVLGYGSAEAIGLKPEDDALIEMGLQVIKDDSQIAEEMLSSLSANKDLPYFMQKLQRTPLRMLEGGLLGEYAGKAIEGIGKVYSLVKNSPRLKSSLETIGTKAQESLDAGDGTTLSSMGAGEIDKAINTQLAKLAPNAQEEILKIARLRNPDKENPKIIVEDLHKYFDQQAIKKNGKKLLLSNPEDYQIILNQAVDDIKLQQQQKVSGQGWYDSDVLKFFNRASRTPGFEKLANNETHRVIMSMVLGATSPGPLLNQNTKAGLAQYLKYVRTGKFSTEALPKNTSLEGLENPGFGQYGYPTGLRTIQFLIEKFGEDGFVDFMLSPHTKKELTDLRLEAGFKSGPAGMGGTADSLHFGAMILGDKAGQFALNINGYSGTTKDKWFVRTIRRYEGTFEDHLVNQLDKKTNTTKTVELGQPKNISERQLMDKFVLELSEKLNLSEQDIQAILWFREQNVYTDLGVLSQPSSFSKAMELINEQEGFGLRSSDEDKIKIEQGTIKPEGYRDVSKGQRVVRQNRRELDELNNQASNGGEPGPYLRGSRSDDEGTGSLVFEPNPEVKLTYEKSGIIIPKINQVDAKNNANQFSTDMASAMANHKYGLQVTIQKPEDLIDAKLYRTEFGGGFAIKENGELVGVFSPTDAPRGTIYASLQLAINQGAIKLDAFNTMLPKIYETVGFKPVSRVKWNDAYAPEGWSKETFAKYNNGEPDLVLFVYDPNYYGGTKIDDLPIFDEYDEAAKIQSQELEKLNTSKNIDDGGPTGQATGSNQGITAYSGSGADFKEFSIEKVGTGQGETNFGYGLYFDANEDIATFFKGEDGKTYKVNLNVKDTDLINVETSFSQQPDNVQNALRKYYDEYGISEDQPVSDLIAAMPNNPASVDYGKTKEFAQDMNSQGLKGLRYKTLSHPNKKTPSDTFVVFDDKVIEILEKYGIVGPVLLSAGFAKEGVEDGDTS